MRINVVSTVWVAETLKTPGRNPAGGIPSAQVDRVYLAAVTGTMRGTVLDVREYT